MKRLAVAFATVVVLVVAPTALAVGSLSGSYKTVIKGSTQFGGQINGTWAIKFTKGQYHVTQDGIAVVHGKDTIKGNVISLRDAKGPNACPAVGKYRFSVKGKKLTFKRLSDSKSPSCLGRGFVLAHTFTKV
jgi:hypothetical protein